MHHESEAARPWIHPDSLNERDRRVKLGLPSVPPRIVTDLLPSLIGEPLLDLCAERSHRTSDATVSPPTRCVNVSEPITTPTRVL